MENKNRIVANKVKEKYPKLFDLLKNIISGNLWREIDKYASNYKRNNATPDEFFDYLCIALHEKELSEAQVAQIMDALHEYKLEKEEEGDYYRELASNLENENDVILISLIKWYYNKYGDQGYWFFVSILATRRDLWLDKMESP
jgi:hypothetical protein